MDRGTLENWLGHWGMADREEFTIRTIYTPRHQTREHHFSFFRLYFNYTMKCNLIVLRSSVADLATQPPCHLSHNGIFPVTTHILSLCGTFMIGISWRFTTIPLGYKTFLSCFLNTPLLYILEIEGSTEISFQQFQLNTKTQYWVLG